MNHTTTSEPHNVATEHWWLMQSGGSPHCPYQPGTEDRAIYDRQIRRMEGLSNGQ